jgi:hypothetical protein
VAEITGKPYKHGITGNSSKTLQIIGKPYKHGHYGITGNHLRKLSKSLVNITSIIL